jgi:hypothetical protein
MVFGSVGSRVGLLSIVLESVQYDQRVVSFAFQGVVYALPLPYLQCFLPVQVKVGVLA